MASRLCLTFIWKIQLPNDAFETTPKAVKDLALLSDTGVVEDACDFPFIEAQLAKFQVVFLLLGKP
ncbi:ser/Thr protein phosphatase [Penicillium canariense]|uniref:Ser/Thr protein phosphatase n=1 Tax=Penicillium canariense TaxID=189055 RepID=A0A9W9LMV6_9EURO|nr:ser/Thr protein phosphatase [Penicillium canariense]KAJ5167259.1 ser/Thr protein phosphatase [Penicillium canariense]